MTIPALRLDPGSGWFEGAARVASPNCDDRPDDTQIDLLIVHAISLPPGRYGGGFVDRLFLNGLDPRVHPYFAEIAGMRVSAHLFVDRGGAVTQYVSLRRRAWHAGQSRFRGRGRCNDFSIGIELEGCDDDPFEDAQYAVLGELARQIMTAWPSITADRVVGHCDVSPGRKTDPGPRFDWDRLRSLL